MRKPSDCSAAAMLAEALWNSAGSIAAINFAGIRLSGIFQNVLTFGLLSLFAIFTGLGLLRGDAAHLEAAVTSAKN